MCATAKFDESIDVAVQLGIDAKKSDQVVRGAVVLPNGTGKTKRVAVFAQGAKAERQGRWCRHRRHGRSGCHGQGRQHAFRRGDRRAGRHARRRYAGPDPGPARPDAPNPKVGTVTPGRGHRGEERQGRPGPVPCRQGRHRASTIGRSFVEPTSSGEPGSALIDALNKAKPASSKGVYLRKVACLVDHGRGRRVDANHLGVIAENGCPRRGWCGGPLAGQRGWGRPSGVRVQADFA